MPFQLSPVAIRKSVRKAIPKDLKWACSPRPWQGWSSSHSTHKESRLSRQLAKLFLDVPQCLKIKEKVAFYDWERSELYILDKNSCQKRFICRVFEKFQMRHFVRFSNTVCTNLFWFGKTVKLFVCWVVLLCISWVGCCCVVYLPKRPNISTPKAAKMKNNRKKSKPKFPTCGKACITVSRRALIPLAIFRSFSTVTRIGLKFDDSWW